MHYVIWGTLTAPSGCVNAIGKSIAFPWKSRHWWSVNGWVSAEKLRYSEWEYQCFQTAVWGKSRASQLAGISPLWKIRNYHTPWFKDLPWVESFRAITEDFISHLRSQNSKPETIVNYERTLKRITNHLHSVGVDSLEIWRQSISHLFYLHLFRILSEIFAPRFAICVSSFGIST